MPGLPSAQIRGLQLRFEIRRIGKDMIEQASTRRVSSGRHARSKPLQRDILRRKHLRPRGTDEIGRGLRRRRGVYIYRHDMSGMLQAHVRKPLGGHKGYRTGPRPDIQQHPVVRAEGHQDTEEHAVGVHLHCGALIGDGKALEPEFRHMPPAQKDRPSCTGCGRTAARAKDHGSLSL